MRILSTLLISLAFTACTTMPDRYARDPQDPEACGYRVESTTSTGFALEVFYKEFKFFPFPDEPVQNAKQCFIRTANRLAAEQGKKIELLLSADINAAPARNEFDGMYSVYAGGRVKFAER